MAEMKYVAQRKMSLFVKMAWTSEGKNAKKSMSTRQDYFDA
jgi:hypothetical protein